MPSILRLAVLLCRLLMMLRASLGTAHLMLVYARWLVKEDDAAGLVLKKISVREGQVSFGKNRILPIERPNPLATRFFCQGLLQRCACGEKR